MDRIRILVADDHALFREGLRALFGSVPDAEVVGEASTGEEAVARAAELSPDVVLMDIQMPGMGGIEAARRITSRDPRVGVIVVTMFDDDGSIFAALRAGARGYVLKGADGDEILKVIRAVADGEAFFGAKVADRLLRFFNAPEPPAEAFPELTSANARSSTSSPGDAETPRSPVSSTSARRPCATTSPTSSPSSTPPIAPRSSSAPARPAWAATENRTSSFPIMCLDV